MTVKSLNRPKPDDQSATLFNVVTRLVLLLAIDSFLFWFIFRAFGEGFVPK